MNDRKDLKTVVVSAVNLVEGGTLSVFHDCLQSLLAVKDQDIRIIALVHSVSLFKKFKDSKIEFIEYPKPKKSWISRIVFEYRSCLAISKKYSPYLWIALHDMTPNVIAQKRMVYCHNPAPFYKITMREAMMEKPFFVFTLLYKFLYKININKNDFIIVQQNWIREYFKKQYHVNNVIVAYPNVNTITSPVHKLFKNNGITRFVYPAFPRVFKNFEVICKAAEVLKNFTENFEVYITISGTENKYATHLYNTYKNISQIKFIGLQKRDAVFDLYATCDCLIFPSKLETWGLPITEMKAFNKPIFVADLNYAHETTGTYDKVCFFNPADHIALSNIMKDLITNNLQFTKHVFTQPAQPFVEGWPALLNFVLSK